MGIYQLIKLEYGCKVKNYMGGRTVIEGCHLHVNNQKWKCLTCDDKFTSKKQLRKHRWDHAI